MRTVLVLVAAAALVAVASCGSSRPPISDNQLHDAAPDGPVAQFVLPVGDPSPDPTTCEEAANAHTYVGCDYWPTVMANVVWSYFDYTVAVSNVGSTRANVTVTGPQGTNRVVVVEPGQVQKIALPWVPALKGTDNGGAVALDASVIARGAAYHLVSDVPVVAYQFSALQYQRTYSGPATPESTIACGDTGVGQCYSYTNDASLLLPSTAWTQTYRVGSLPGEGSVARPDFANGGYVVVVAARASTTVTIDLSPTGAVLAGGGIPATDGDGKVTTTLDAGDVLQLVTPAGYKYDLSGSIVAANGPVEVFTGNPCKSIPAGASACDHIEESVLPAEVLGRNYIVTVPTRPAGGLGSHALRFYGNRDGTTLTYFPARPGNCPETLNAGDVVDCGMLKTDFIVQGSEEISLASFTASAQAYSDRRGDPDQTIYAAVEQYRTRYVFLAPNDYDVSYAVVTGPSTAAPVIDGVALTGYSEISGGYGVWRAQLAADRETHVLTSSQAVGLQVMGYGAYTSYTYPGGLSLRAIAPPPVLK